MVCGKRPPPSPFPNSRSAPVVWSILLSLHCHYCCCLLHVCGAVPPNSLHCLYCCCCLFVCCCSCVCVWCSSKRCLTNTPNSTPPSLMLTWQLWTTSLCILAAPIIIHIRLAGIRKAITSHTACVLSTRGGLISTDPFQCFFSENGLLNK